MIPRAGDQTSNRSASPVVLRDREAVLSAVSSPVVLTAEMWIGTHEFDGRPLDNPQRTECTGTVIYFQPGRQVSALARIDRKAKSMEDPGLHRRREHAR